MSIDLRPRRIKRSPSSTTNSPTLPSDISIANSPSGSNAYFKIAENRHERRAAFCLTYKSYLRAGLIKPNRYEMRITPFHLSDSTTTFVGLQRDRSVCTASLVQDGDLGLPMEVVYGKEVQRMRRNGYRLAEVSCLAFEPTAAGAAVFWQRFLGLNGLMAQFARHHGVDRVLIAVHPRHARFYQRFIGFEVIGEITRYPAVRSHPAVACCLNFDRADRIQPPMYGDLFRVPVHPAQLTRHSISNEDRHYFLTFVDRPGNWLPVVQPLSDTA